MRVRDDVPLAVIGAIDLSVPLDAVVVFKETGAQIALWTRNPVPSDVVTVMTSTLLGSAETLLETLGDVRPASLVVETDVRRILVLRLESGMALSLVAPKALPEAALRDEAYRLARVVQSVRPPVATPAGERVSLPSFGSR